MKVVPRVSAQSSSFGIPEAYYASDAQSAYQAIVDGTACKFDPVLSIADICEACVTAEFKGKTILVARQSTL